MWIDLCEMMNLADMKTDVSRRLLFRARSDKIGTIPHMLFCGINGSGVKRHIMLFLHHVFGKSAIDSVKSVEIPIKRKSDAKKDSSTLFLVQSRHHVCMNPSNLEPGLHVVAVQTIVNEFLKQRVVTSILPSTMTASSSSSTTSTGTSTGTSIETSIETKDGTKDGTGVISPPNFRFLIILGVDHFIEEAQRALNAEIETNCARYRIIFTCNNLAKVTPELKSRCAKIRNPAPNSEHITQILTKILEDFPLEERFQYGKFNENKQSSSVLKPVLGSTLDSTSTSAVTAITTATTIIETKDENSTLYYYDNNRKKLIEDAKKTLGYLSKFCEGNVRLAIGDLESIYIHACVHNVNFDTSLANHISTSSNLTYSFQKLCSNFVTKMITEPTVQTAQEIIHQLQGNISVSIILNPSTILDTITQLLFTRCCMNTKFIHQLTKIVIQHEITLCNGKTTMVHIQSFIYSVCTAISYHRKNQ
jgi:DNA polymerase III delta prime subunit